jgi:hypothetical protein
VRKSAGEGGVRREAEPQGAAEDERAGRELHRRIDGAEAGEAAPAAAAQDGVRDDWDVVVPRDLGGAGPAGRTSADDRAPLRHACRDDVQEAAEREPAEERERESESHPLPYRRGRPAG